MNSHAFKTAAEGQKNARGTGVAHNLRREFLSPGEFSYLNRA